MMKVFKSNLLGKHFVKRLLQGLYSRLLDESAPKSEQERRQENNHMKDVNYRSLIIQQ